MNSLSQKELSSSGGLSFPWEELYNWYFERFRKDAKVVVNVQLPLSRSQVETPDLVLENLQENTENQTGNIILDMYCLEGMKLFNQGPFASNIKPKSEEGL